MKVSTRIKHLPVLLAFAGFLAALAAFGQSSVIKSDGGEQPQPPAQPEKPKPDANAPAPQAPSSSFDPSDLILTAEQRQKAQWALVEKIFSEKDPSGLSATQADLAMSPASLINGLQALWWGTRGETAQELAELFTADLISDSGSPRTPDPQTGPAHSPEKSAALGGSVTLNMHSGLWFNQSFPLKDSYRTLLKNRGLGTAESLDWSNINASLARINQWCASATGGKIESLFQPGDIQPPVAFVLASVITFKGSWSQSFDKQATRLGDFTLLDGQKIPAAFLTASRKTRFAALEDGTKLLELPFAGGHQRFVAVLPAKPGAKALGKLERQVAAKMPEWMNAMAETDVSISVPKFDTSGSIDPAASLKALGVKRLLSDKDADFSGASESRGLKLDVIRHQAVVSIDESGAEAAGATGVSVTLKSLEAPPSFHADRPFLFFILGDDGDVLFAGRTAAPTADSTPQTKKKEESR